MKRIIFYIILGFAMALVFSPAGPLVEKAVAYSVNEVHLTDGKTFDITGSPKNTIVYIDDSTANSGGGRAEVTLKGSSEKVWVSISVSSQKTVIVNLADGLKITPTGDSAYGTGDNNDTLGWSRSGIYIDETKHAGGVVVLRSLKNAKITIDSWQCGVWQAVPAIMKNNTKTKLVFETEDKNNPGTIIAKPTRGGDFSGTVGIGAYGHGTGGSASSSYTVGNIDFHAGNIEAYGYFDGPGIGAYAYSHVKDLTFSGANVKAYAGNERPTFEMHGSAGIGSDYYGNVESISITGGRVEAWGFGSRNDPRGWPLRNLLPTCGCGIGVGQLGHLGEISISGGTVIAYGGTADGDTHSTSGCGIGTLVSKQQNYSNSDGDKITITGGDITAYGGDDTCGIGGCVKEITIAPKDENTQLKINAAIDDRANREGGKHSLGSGIGIAGNVDNNKYKDYKGNITIKGGDITVYSGNRGTTGYYGDGHIFFGAGIGPTRYGRIDTINITGGTIYAHGGWCCPGIGGTNDNSGYNGSVENIYISGGTITAEKAATHDDGAALSGIGGYKKGNSERTNIRITGGSIIANGTDYAIGFDAAGQPKNDAGETVYGTKFKFNPDAGEWKKVDSYNFDPDLSYDYGLNDVYTKKGLDGESGDNIVEFWIPKVSESGSVSKLYTGDRRYGSFDDSFAPVKVKAGDTATLSGFTDITYKSAKEGYIYNGTGVGVYGNNCLSIDPMPGATTLYKPGGYMIDSNHMVANPSEADGKTGNLVYSTDYTDEYGKWIAKTGTLTLYVAMEQTHYLVSYDKNQPQNASHDVAGEQMGDSTFSVDGSSTLTDNAYSLAGWDFKGWNTKADGNGDWYGPGTEHGNTIAYNEAWGEHLMLYAIWAPKEYRVKLVEDAGAGTSYQYDYTMSYDTQDTLPKIGWLVSDQHWSIPAGKTFFGWRRAEALGSLWKDGAACLNLCTLDADGVPQGWTLDADLADAEKIVVSVTNDGAPVAGLDDCFRLLLVQDGTAYTMPATYDGFKYTFDPAYASSGTTIQGQLPPGNYTLIFDTDLDETVEEKYEFTKVEDLQYGNLYAINVFLDYYTVTMSKDSNISSAWVSPPGGTTQPAELKRVRNGSEILVQASADPGYHFDGYSYYGIEPGWEEDPSVAEQKITVNGKVDLTAHAEPNVYHVAYDPNKPDNASHDVEGSMVDSQDCVYDEQQALAKNEYTLTGWTFKGWNTQANGGGASFADKESMTTEKWDTAGPDGPPSDNADVTLYAQWEANKYTVKFDENTGSGSMGPQEMTYDTKENLTPNQFRKTDWHFTGWNTLPSGNGDAFEDGQEVVNLATKGTATLYAQWEHDYYIVQFDKNDDAATGEMKEEHVWTNSGYEMPLCSFCKKGYSFESWNTQADGGGIRYEQGDVLENALPKGETLTLYVQWKPNSYTVKFDANTGSGSMEEETFTYDKAQKLDANKFKKKHYVFTEWNTSAEGSGLSFKNKASVENLTTQQNHTVILYAQWEREKHTISFDLNGGKYKGRTGVVEITCSYGDIIKLPKPTREGYTFDYWKGSKYKAGAKYTVKENHDFKAIWKKGSGGISTGDGANPALWLLLVLASAAGILALLLLRRSRKS